MILAALIAKNEERDIARCLRSIAPIVDGVVLVDTGSTDNTLEVATSCVSVPVWTQTYTGASKQDANGDWKLWNFSKARNVSVAECERRGADRIFWMDADEELLTPNELLSALPEPHDLFALRISNAHRAGQLHVGHRIWRTGLGIRFEGAIHEYLNKGNAKNALDLPEVIIKHDDLPGVGETSNDRNLRILLKEWKRKPTPRSAYYLGHEYRHIGDLKSAVAWYTRRIAMGAAFRDEWLFTHLYKARCQRALGDLDGAHATLFAALQVERGWAEFWCELAYMALQVGRFAQAAGFALQCELPIPRTLLSRETDKYRAEPERIIDIAGKAEAEGLKSVLEASPAF